MKSFNFVLRLILVLLMMGCGIPCEAVNPLAKKIKEKSFVPVDSIPGEWIVVSIVDSETGETYETSKELQILPFSVDEKSFKTLHMSHSPQAADSVVVQKSDKGDVINALTYWVSQKDGHFYTDDLQITLGDFVRKPTIHLSLSDLVLAPEGLVCKEGKMSFTNSSGEVQ